MKFGGKLGVIAMTVGLLGSLFLEPAQAMIGIMSRFGDVVLENMKPGVYNLRELRSLPYVVTNSGDARTEILVEVREPKAPVDGYEAIPDPAWLQIVPNRFFLDPKQNHFSDIILSVPEDQEFAGRHFQAEIWAHTIGTGFTAAGVTSRLRFSIGTYGPETLQKEKKRKAMLTLDFDLKPESLYVSGVEVGRSVNLKNLKRQAFKLSNRADAPLKVRLVSIAWDPQFTLPEGYAVAPDPGWLRINPKEKTAKPLTITEFIPVVNIPDSAEHRGKKYGFLIKAEVVAEKSLPIEVYSRLLIATGN